MKKTCTRFELAYWLSVSQHNNNTKEPIVSGRHRKAFNSLQSYFTGSIDFSNFIQLNESDTELVMSGIFVSETISVSSLMKGIRHFRSEKQLFTEI